ncbi:MAG TPA: ABC transporter permease [Spirochaetota bacterium]|mgnify:CR=1 FL=1|nr:ABC transporter permease [Spirochaetota bacterium]HPI24163.1 ABC transporter permease [Spirochaetota bacterium]HPU88721.1 ABC transporter permease [Spirochaetota bacterium]
MQTIFAMGWRNIWRHRRRSLVVISSIALGIFAMILSMGIMNGMNNQAIENTIRTALGHIAIHRKGFHEDMKIAHNFKSTDRIMRSIAADRRIAAAAPRVKLPGMVRSSETSQGVLIVGIDPEKEMKISNLYQYTSKENGSRFLASPDENAALISQQTADRLKLVVGDKLVLMLQDRNNEIVGVGMTVAGTFQTPVESFDKLVVFTGIGKLQEITGLGENISEISIAITDPAAITDIKRRLIGAIGDDSLEVLTWMDMAPYLVSAVKFFDTIMYITFVIIFLVVVFSVANTLVMAIMERFHEIGVMKSIGTRPSWIATMIVFEAVNLGLVGLVAGVAAGTLSVAALSIGGINLGLFMESLRAWGTGSVIFPVIKGMDIVVAALIVLATTVLAAVYPAVKAARIKPLEALHFV